jgi:hypothetical protein
MNRQTVVVCNAVVWHERRLQAAQQQAHGLRIVTVQQLAEVLAGGFLQIVSKPDLQQLVSGALSELHFGSIEEIKALPGMVNAVCRSLQKAWNAKLDLERWGQERGESVADLVAIEAYVRAHLPPGSLLPNDISRLAITHANQARHVTGDVEVHGIVGLAPCWRPLIAELAKHVAVRWHACKADGDDLRWVEGTGIELIWHAERRESHYGVACANPKHETLEALRWARELISSKRANPHEIAIVAASVEDWDDHFRALVADSQLPVHFAHGVPAVSRYAGQQCAALAEIMLHGLSHDRVIRALRAVRDCDALANLPEGWYTKLAPEAPLLLREHWDFELARVAGEDGSDFRPVLVPVLDVLGAGPEAAAKAGEMLLDGQALAIWKQALLDGPPQALATTLAAQRILDTTDPAANIVWGSAAAVLGSERKFVRLLGLNSSQWPRRTREDSLLPSHLVPAAELEPLSVSEFDRLCFRHLCSRAREVVYSRSRRGNDGRLLGPSPLLPSGVAVQRLVRARIPQHAMSESDRLLANREEFRNSALAQSAAACTANWRKTELTAHDGIVRANHPVIVKRLKEAHSTSSLKLLLTDPLAFLWQYCLGWWEPRDLAGEQPVILDGLAEGSLYHEMLECAVKKLEQKPGAMAKASAAEINTAIDDALAEISVAWARTNPTPPPRIWQRVLARGREVVLAAFHEMPAALPQQRTYVEVPFGYADEPADGRPWDPAVSVTFNVDGFSLPLRGWIDRLDISGDRTRARVLDYKTVGAAPKEDPGLKRGQELQRCVYAYVVRQLIAGSEVEAALMYPGQENGYLPLTDADALLAQLSATIACAASNAQQGRFPFGATAEEKADKNYEYAPLFALPANAKGLYFPLKRNARDAAVGDLLQLWTEAKA